MACLVIRISKVVFVIMHVNTVLYTPLGIICSSVVCAICKFSAAANGGGGGACFVVWKVISRREFRMQICKIPHTLC